MSACIIYSRKGGFDGHGYGQFYALGKCWKAHRVSWELAYGPIPEGMHVLHKCDVRACVNPEHLFLGTTADNVADMMAKGRHRALSGEAHPSARLTKARAEEIRVLAAGGVSQRSIAQRFGISQSLVQLVTSGKRYQARDGDHD